MTLVDTHVYTLILAEPTPHVDPRGGFGQKPEKYQSWENPLNQVSGLIFHTALTYLELSSRPNILPPLSYSYP